MQSIIGGLDKTDLNSLQELVIENWQKDNNCKKYKV